VTTIKRQLCLAAGIFIVGIVLTAAALDPRLPANYWDAPQAGSGSPPHDWSALEADLRPEACAQCHSEQFNAWQQSLHAYAFSPGMIGQFPSMGADEANSCLVCHAPLAEQRLRDQDDVSASLLLKLKRPDGVNRDADLDAPAQPLRHSGISCAVCHVRGWQRFGPPPKGSGAVGHQQTGVHGGFTATRVFEQSQFCASCHQFSDNMAINGKPLENTLNEWKKSSFSKSGISCQQCHMPGRRHEFRGIHNLEMVKSGLRFELIRRDDHALLRMTSIRIGHAFPTYVTPKVVIDAAALDASGRALRSWQWEIVREVVYDNGWQELRDTRLMPGEQREFVAAAAPSAAVSVCYRVRVMPDHFYKDVYRDLLSGRISESASAHITRALQRAEGDDYLLYAGTIRLH